MQAGGSLSTDLKAPQAHHHDLIPANAGNARAAADLAARAAARLRRA
jgi:hypothetical protein